MSAIPCKRPKVTIEDLPTGLAIHRCHVPGCGWTYKSVKTDHLGAPHHRREHRAAVPTVTFEKVGPFQTTATCSCGKRDTKGTRTDAQAWAESHLVHDHGLVTCS